jgi:hypothetical protein
LDSLIVLLASTGLALFLLWAASRIQGVTAFEVLPDWLRSSYGAFWGLLLSGTGVGLAIIKVLKRKGQSTFNFLYAILGTSAALLLAIVLLTHLFKPPGSVATGKTNETSLPPKADPSTVQKSVSPKTECVIALNQDVAHGELQEMTAVSGSSPGQVWTAYCSGFQPNVPVTAQIEGVFSETGPKRFVSVVAAIEGSHDRSTSFGGPIRASGYTLPFQLTITGNASDKGEVRIDFHVVDPAHGDGATITAGLGSKIWVTAHAPHPASAANNNQKSGDGGQCANLVASGNGSINCSSTQEGKGNAPKNPQKQ